MSSNADSEPPKPRERKPRRAEVQIYRPGALRQMREAVRLKNEADKAVEEKEKDGKVKHQITQEVVTKPIKSELKKESQTAIKKAVEIGLKLEISTDIDDKIQSQKSDDTKQSKTISNRKKSPVFDDKMEKSACKKVELESLNAEDSDLKCSSVGNNTEHLKPKIDGTNEKNNESAVGKSYSRVRLNKTCPKDGESTSTNIRDRVPSQITKIPKHPMRNCSDSKPSIHKGEKKSSNPTIFYNSNQHDHQKSVQEVKTDKVTKTSNSITKNKQSVATPINQSYKVSVSNTSDKKYDRHRKSSEDSRNSNCKLPTEMNKNHDQGNLSNIHRNVSLKDDSVNVAKKMTGIVQQRRSVSTTDSENGLHDDRSINHAKVNQLPADTQRKDIRKHKKRSPNKDTRDPMATRGIIHIPTTSSTFGNDMRDTITETKALFNPNNPSKPMLVPTTTRVNPPPDVIPTSVGKCGSASIGSSVDVFFEDSKVDPSVLYNTQKGEMDINYYVSSNQIHLEFERIMVIRQHLKDCYYKLLHTDIRLCQEKNIDASLWKCLYYMIIEKLREYITNLPKLREASLKILCMIVEDGQEYFQKLIQMLQDTYEFSLDQHIIEDLTSKPYTKNRIRLAISMCQRFLLSLGDLARYKDQYTTTPNYILSRKWYMMAQEVLPRNGRPFNQLAILSGILKRPLDVVYYYIRSLTAANPFLSARDSLVAIFEDFRKMYESMNKNNDDTTQADQDNMSKMSTSCRQEIWIRPDNGLTNKRTLSENCPPEEDSKNKMEELSQLSSEQLMKQFLTCYLHCHGMLFSKVGLDALPDVLKELLQMYKVLLKTTPPRLSYLHLLQIHAINIFAIDNTQLKDSQEYDNGYRSAAQDLALLLSQEMFGCLCEVTVSLLPSNLNYPLDSSKTEASDSDEITAGDPSKLFLPGVASFIPAIKIWCDWLLYNSCIWNPPASHDITDGASDAWNKVAELATLVKGIGPMDVNIYENHVPQGSLRIQLPEDRYLRGYSPLLSSQNEEMYVAPESSMGRAEDWARLNKMALCLCQFLCGVEPPVLRLQKTDHGQILVSLVQNQSNNTFNYCNSVDEEGSEDGVTSEDVDDIEIGDDGVLGQSMIELIRRKRELEKDLREQKKFMEKNEGPITSQIEIRPRNLIPDTNCFIKYLDIIKRLVSNSPYVVMVPIAVIDELSKMSRDLALDKYGDAAHAMRVRENASDSVDYLKQMLKQSNRALKCITSQGSILTSSFFVYEATDDDMSNDDRILSCCIHLCSGSTRTRPISEGVRRVYRDVVLLTDDRGLRIKAHIRDVPVRTMLDFAQWADIPIN